MDYLFIQERKCYRCKQVKDRAFFSKDAYDKFGLQSRCKDCDKIRNQKYQAENKEYFQRKGKEYYNKADNAARYAKTRDAYLSRRQEYSKSVRGRFSTLLHSAKTRAEKKNLAYDLDICWLLDRYEAQNGCCFLTGIELNFKNLSGKKRYQPFAPSLDKINPVGPYTKDNTRLVCVAVNVALNDFGEDILKQVCEGYLQQLKIRSNDTTD